MANIIQRERQVVRGNLTSQDLAKRAEQGWRMAAIDWEREIPEVAEQRTEEVPFGLKIAAEAGALEVNPGEWQALVLMMELTVQEGPYWKIAEELNRRGFRDRHGDPWTSISVFRMLPRLIEVGPRIFASDEWRKAREQLQRSGD